MLSALQATAKSKSRIDLGWVNSSNFTLIKIERKTTGAYAVIASIAGTASSYVDNSLADGTTYTYRIRGWTPGDGYGDYTNESSAMTILPAPSNVDGAADEPTKITINWTDNSQNETRFDVWWKTGTASWAFLESVGKNVTTYQATGLAPATWHYFKVLANKVSGEFLFPSAFSNEARIFTSDPPKKPSNLTATPTAIDKVRLNWKDNSNNEVDFHIEQSATGPTSGFSQIATVGKNVTTYEAIGLGAAQYWFRVRAHRSAGYSGYSNVATAVPLADIAAPTNVVATAISSIVAEVTFDDNSNAEDDHHVEVNTNGAGFAEIGQLAPNRTYFCITIAPGSTYAVRIRAHQTLGDLYSDYSNEATVAPLAVPAAPVLAAITEYQDTWVRLTWTLSVGELGYRIQQSIDNGANYTDVVTIGAGISTLKIGGLTANFHYHFQVCAYNGAGNSAYDDEGVTTRAAYLFSKFEKLIRKSKPRLIYLIEVNPLLVLTGWALTGGQNHTYETGFDEGGAILDGVSENGVALTVKTSIVTVEGTAGTYWHDTTNKIVYVHPSDDGAPIDHLITGSFWLYFTTWQRGTTIYDGNYYLPLIAADGIPDISQEIQPFYEGNFTISSGSISFINGKFKKHGFYFDRIFRRYEWLNRKARIRAGGDGFAYSDFRTVNTGIAHSANITDQRFVLNLRDIRDGIHRDIPTEKYSLAIFPGMDEDKDGQERPFAFGAIINAIPNCLDKTNRVFDLHNGRIKSVSMTQNAVALTENMDYFVDYKRGRFTLAKGLSYLEEDVLLVAFTACVNEADDTAANGADAFRMICNDFLGLTDSSLDLDAIYATKVAKTVPFSLYLRTATGSQAVIKTIEQSIGAYSVQDEEGRIGLRAEQTAPASGAPYIWDLHVSDFSAELSLDSLFSEVNVYYGEDPSRDAKYSLSQTFIPSMAWRCGIRKPLDLYVALSSATDAAALGTAIATLMECLPISFTVPGVLFTCQPGDVVPFNRSRFPSSFSGSAANLPVRILGIDKLISSSKTRIKGEVIE